MCACVCNDYDDFCNFDYLYDYFGDHACSLDDFCNFDSMIILVTMRALLIIIVILMIIFMIILVTMRAHT